MLRKVKLYGKLAEFVGHKEFEVKVDSVGKAVSFLIHNFPGLEAYMSPQYYQVKVGNYEIDEIFNVPLSFLMDEDNINYNEFSRKDLKVYIPTWVYNGNKIWGLTALITADLLNTCFNASIKTDLDLMRTYDDY